MNFSRTTCLLVWSCCQLSTGFAQTPIPSDSHVRTGKLANGFTYFIRENKEPNKRAVFYLAVKAGSILEEEKEQGLAHFTEHLAFKGTKNFPKQEVINFLQKAGVRFGADLNAYTSYDETVFQLPIPTDNPEVLEKGVQILRDWAQDVSFLDEDINTERGVILEEKRMRSNLQTRIQKQTMPILLNNSRYVDRLPIGTEQVLTTFQPKTLRKFYQKWYRPNLQALVAVGDFNADSLEQVIKQKFGDLKNAPKAPARTKYGVKLANTPHYLAITDPEISNTTAEILLKYPEKEEQTEEALRKDLVTSFFNALISGRISELSKQEKPPFDGARIGIQSIHEGIKASAITVQSKSGELEKGLKAINELIAQIKQQGFLSSELDRLKQSFLRGQELSYQERDKTTSEAYVKQYLQAFLKDEPYPDATFFYEFYKKQAPTITVTEINQLIGQFDIQHSKNRDIFITAPEKDKDKLPKEQEILSWLQPIQGAVAAYVDSTSNAQLIEQLPQPGSIVKEEKDTTLGTTSWTLNNGIRVVVKPTTFQNNQILISAFSPGGNSLYNDQDYVSATNATSVVTTSGLGAFDSKALPKLLAGKMVSVSPYISSYFEGFQAQSNREDLETAFQLMYLYATAPRLDEPILKGLIDKLKISVSHRYDNPDNIFQDTVSAVINRYHPRYAAPSIEKIDQISLHKALEIYKDRFADASDFTFVLTGSIDTAQLKPLLTQYLATLPATHRVEKGRDLGIYPPTGQITKKVYSGKENKATVYLLSTGEYQPSEKLNLCFSALQEILKIKLTERLRGQESGVYTPGVEIQEQYFPTHRYSVSINFTCDPKNVDRLIAASKDEVQKLIKNGPSEVDLEKFKAESIRGMEVGQKTNGFWQSYILSTYQYQLDPKRILSQPATLKQLTATEVQAAAKQYLGLENLMQFIQYPAQQ